MALSLRIVLLLGKNEVLELKFAILKSSWKAPRAVEAKHFNTPE